MSGVIHADMQKKMRSRPLRLTSRLWISWAESARDESEADFSEARMRSLLAASQSTPGADVEVAEQRGQRWDPGAKVSWGGLPWTSVDGVDAAVSAWAADLRGNTLGKECAALRVKRSSANSQLGRNLMRRPQLLTRLLQGPSLIRGGY